MTALARALSNRKRQSRFPVRLDAQHQQSRKCLIVVKIWYLASNRSLTQWKTCRPTVGHNITFTLTLRRWLVGEWVSELDNRWGSIVVSCCCEKLVAEAVGRGTSTFEAATKQRLLKTVTVWQNLVCPIMICEMCKTVREKSLLVITSCKSSVNQITNSNPVYSHSGMWQYHGNIKIQNVLQLKAVTRAGSDVKHVTAPPSNAELSVSAINPVMCSLRKVHKVDTWSLVAFVNPYASFLWKHSRYLMKFDTWC
jgi:hypothetical protein